MQGHVATHGKAWSNYAEITDSFCRLEDGLHPASAFENQDTANIGKHGKTWENMGRSEPSAWLTSLSSGSHHWNTVDKRHLHHLCLQDGNVSEFPAERLARQIRSGYRSSYFEKLAQLNTTASLGAYQISNITLVPDVQGAELSFWAQHNS